MPTIALIAHDDKKDELVGFCRQHREQLAAAELIATGTTGSRVAEATGLKVERMLSGPMGGDAQIARPRVRHVGPAARVQRPQRLRRNQPRDSDDSDKWAREMTSAGRRVDMIAKMMRAPLMVICTLLATSASAFASGEVELRSRGHRPSRRPQGSGRLLLCHSQGQAQGQRGTASATA